MSSAAVERLVSDLDISGCGSLDLEARPQQSGMSAGVAWVAFLQARPLFYKSLSPASLFLVGFADTCYFVMRPRQRPYSIGQH